MRTPSKIVSVVACLAILAGAGDAWVTIASDRVLRRDIETHSVAFPIPFGLTETEVVASALDEKRPDARALDEAIERGRHLVESRYACAECHGEDFGGGVMVDAAPIGRILGPNLTLGEGGSTSAYGPADWDRAVRHGVKPDGRPSLMPSEDYARMSDQELSDVVTYVRSLPPVDHVVPPVRLGPIGRFLVATGRMPLSANVVKSHDGTHPVLPPAADVSVDFGRHLAGVCIGCHGSDLSGGAVPGADPSWPPAANITPSDEGLGGWSYDDFVAAMREGRLPDGREVRVPMAAVIPYALRMTEVELRALWMYLTSVPAVTTAGNEK